MSEPSKKRRQCIIFDIDGTLALRGDRDPYDMTRVGEDVPNLPVQRIFLLLSAGALALPEVDPEAPTLEFIFTSGRDESARQQTEMWLQHHVISEHQQFRLLMRTIGDNRPDHEVKLEMLYKIRTVWNYGIIAAFDDRDRVVKMWRDNGVTCFQVAPGDF